MCCPSPKSRCVLKAGTRFPTDGITQKCSWCSPAPQGGLGPQEGLGAALINLSKDTRTPDQALSLRWGLM